MKIAIDGPSGAGKTSTAKLLAEKTGFVYIDTGAMYRAVGLYCIRNCINTKDDRAVTEALQNIKISYSIDSQAILLNGEDVALKIRTNEVSMAASDVSAIPAVRHALVKMQGNLIRNIPNVIMEGRDIGTCVMPDADVKIYLTADEDSRIHRRMKQEIEKKGKMDEEEMHKFISSVTESIRQRDYNDMNREMNPLRKAEDAVEIDNTNLNLKETAEKIMNVMNNPEKGQA